MRTTPVLTNKLKQVCIGIAASRLSETTSDRFRDIKEASIDTMKWVLQHPNEVLSLLQDDKS